MREVQSAMMLLHFPVESIASIVNVYFESVCEVPTVFDTKWKDLGDLIP